MQCNFCSCRIDQIYKVRNLKPYCNTCYERFVKVDEPDFDERAVFAWEKIGTLLEKNNNLTEEFLEHVKRQSKRDKFYYTEML